MRLIDVDTIELKSFSEQTVPRYAILSHTWGPDEVSYQELSLITRMRSLLDTYSNQRASRSQQAVASGNTALMLAAMEMLLHGDRDIGTLMTDLSEGGLMKREGYSKIVKSAAEAKRLGYQYIWCDTCCIDKTSSTELQEAINSMYHWYKKSDVCLVYLNDVEPVGFAAPSSAKDVFHDCRWRGWTLQELIAPRHVRFYFQDWSLMGDKNQFAEALCEVTGIPTFILENGDLSEVSIANRMSWCATRETTRIEDIAYCLLGIFDIQMPLLYGEGDKAFLRLQEEILKTMDDYSIFAWLGCSQEIPSGRACLRGLLARSPKEFFLYSEKTVEPEDDASAFPIIATPIGIRLQLELELAPVSRHDTSHFTAFIRCTDNENSRLAITLRRLDDGNQYARVHSSGISHRDDWPTGKLTTIYVRQKVSIPYNFYTPDFPAFCIQRQRTVAAAPIVCISKVYPPEHWNADNKQLVIPRHFNKNIGFLGVLFLQGQISEKEPPIDFQVVLGFDTKAETYWCKSVVHPWPKFANISPERFRAVIKRVLPQDFPSPLLTQDDTRHDIFIGGDNDDMCVNINLRAGMHGDSAVLKVLIDGLVNGR
ncbi:unnamed protein product [Periconia digitata]|uniref:Heterokaryon incompatibility domain-containing protein n=1 Tax=Periconia digitata TaxID=1303443 RepID=A0A9W4XHN5_9PLEO|nr:unnamed protein product [Periconia digitata]